MKPVVLAPNTLASFYRGAGRIRDFRRDSAVDPAHAEDWIGATTVRFGTTDTGRTRLTDGATLASHFQADPEGWFGPSYTGRYGARGALLVKLLDAGSRLPLHVHPDRPFARAHLASDFGKSEAWLVLHADPGASAHLGFSRDIGAEELDDLVERQDASALLAACNSMPLASGDVVFCPGGVPHAIGEGVLILEIQEMTDFSIMLEWADFPIDPATVYLGLDRATALGAVRRDALVGDALTDLAGQCIRGLGTGAPGITQLMPDGAATLFGAEQVLPSPAPVELDQRFSVLVVNEGAGTIDWGDDVPAPVTAGEVYLVPFSAGPITIAGAVSAIRCYPA